MTTLAVAAVDWYKIDLAWTAPTDVPAQAVHHYEIRYSLSPIDEANFDAATLIADPPTPAAPGTSQTFTVTGLQPLTQYYFAIRCFDGIGLTSPLSNVVSATTIVTDAIPPAAINDLAIVETHPNFVVMRWTAVGDDGLQGPAAGYELRYSTSPIDEATFAGATLVATATPKASGQTETLTLRGLSPATTYYFAIKAKDEVPNYASLSNVPATQTLPADTQPPTTVTDLRVLGMHIRMAKLAWTAPADLGDSGTKAYELRYSTSPIDEANWAAASPVADLPVPATPGSTESVVVTGLQPSTTYYFAVRTSDWAEPSNLSAVSNVPSGTTRAPSSPSSCAIPGSAAIASRTAARSTRWQRPSTRPTRPMA